MQPMLLTEYFTHFLYMFPTCSLEPLTSTTTHLGPPPPFKAFTKDCKGRQAIVGDRTNWQKQICHEQKPSTNHSVCNWFFLCRLTTVYIIIYPPMFKKNLRPRIDPNVGNSVTPYGIEVSCGCEHSFLSKWGLSYSHYCSFIIWRNRTRRQYITEQETEIEIR
jgi:hypothetical protein